MSVALIFKGVIGDPDPPSLQQSSKHLPYRLGERERKGEQSHLLQTQIGDEKALFILIKGHKDPAFLLYNPAFSLICQIQQRLDSRFMVRIISGRVTAPL